LTLTCPLRCADIDVGISPSSKCWNDGFQLGSGVMNENVEKCEFSNFDDQILIWRPLF
jgi:hypothetical protein